MFESFQNYQVYNQHFKLFHLLLHF